MSEMECTHKEVYVPIVLKPAFLLVFFHHLQDFVIETDMDQAQDEVPLVSRVTATLSDARLQQCDDVFPVFPIKKVSPIKGVHHGEVDLSLSEDGANEV